MQPNEDPRLTAYALGEMTDAERIAFEADLAANPETLAEIESIRTVAASLSSELQHELNAIPAKPTSLKIAPPSRRRIERWVLAAAASVAVGGLVMWTLTPSLNRAREMAFQSDRQQGSHAGGLTGLQESESIAVQSKAAAIGQPGIVGGKDKLDVRQPTLSSKLAFSYEYQRDDRSRKLSLPVLENAYGDGVADARFGQIQGGVASDKIDAVVHSSRDGDQVLASRDPFLSRFQDEMRAKADNESYAKLADNPFLDPRNAPLSTFGIDVDTASYSNVRRMLESGQRPPADAVRIEELINYFPTGDVPPTDGKPFAVHMEVAACPWMPAHQLVRVAIKGQVIQKDARPLSNLVFLIDVSGSMNEPNKLPLVKRSLRKLVGQLGENDRVAIVVYAGTSGLVLPSTNASDKAAILKAIDNLEAGGSTNGGQGIELAYATALEHLAKDANGNTGSNRVILCTDGDFNVGVTDRTALLNLIAEKAKAGVFLNVLGFGTGNIKDDTMEGLADKGNGQYGYIDSDREADKVFVEQLGGTLVTIAKDVKLQLEFNPATVKSYRLVGYENRVMAAQDFNNDLKDSGDLGAGHNVVALYEIDPAGQDRLSDPASSEPALKYQPKHDEPAIVPADSNTTDLLTLKLRYKKPDAPLEQGTSELIETTLGTRDASAAPSAELKFDASVAGFGMLLRESPNRGNVSWEMVRSLARDGIGDDVGGHRTEFLNLIDAAQKLR